MDGLWFWTSRRVCRQDDVGFSTRSKKLPSRAVIAQVWRLRRHNNTGARFPSPLTSYRPPAPKTTPPPRTLLPLRPFSATRTTHSRQCYGVRSGTTYGRRHGREARGSPKVQTRFPIRRISAPESQHENRKCSDLPVCQSLSLSTVNLAILYLLSEI